MGNETRKGPQAVHRQTTRVLLLLGHEIPSVARATVHCLTILGNETRKGPQAVHRQTTRVLLLLGHGIPRVAHATVHCLTILGNETRKGPQADHRQTTLCSSCLVMGYRASRMPLCTV